MADEDELHNLDLDEDELRKLTPEELFTKFDTDESGAWILYKR